MKQKIGFLAFYLLDHRTVLNVAFKQFYDRG